MKKIYPALILCVLFAMSAFAQTPSFSYIQTIDVSSYGVTPTALAFYNGDVYVATFGDQKVLKIEDAISTPPTAGIFADLSGETTWNAGRGLQGLDVDQSTGEVYASGDSGNGHAVFKMDTSGNVIANLTDENAGHRNAGCALWGSSPSLLVAQSGDGMFNVVNDLSGYESTAYLSGGSAYKRDVCIAGDNVYFSRTNGGATDGIDKFTGGTAGDLADYTGSAWLDLSGGSWQAAVGIHSWQYNSNWLILLANQIDDTLDIYQESDATKLTSLGASDDIDDPRDSCVGTFGSDEYLFVSDSLNDVIHVFGVDGATSVKNWTMY